MSAATPAPGAQHGDDGGPAVDEAWVTVQGGRLYARRWLPAAGAAAAVGPAAAAPLLLLHDSLGCVAAWRDFPAALAARTGRAVIAYDRLGFGRSDPATGPLSPAFIRAEADHHLAALCAAFGLQRYVAFGHSVGGAMAVHCAADRPACAALVTASAQAFVEPRTLDGIRAAAARFRDPERRARLARLHGERAAWVLAAWIETWLDPGFAGWTLAPVLPRVRCPVLALHGDADEYGSTRHAEAIVSGVAGPARLAVLAGIGHFPHRECEDAVLAQVAGFLAAPAPAPGPGAAT